MLAAFSWAALKNKVFHIEGNYEIANLVAASAVMGLGLDTYYINRAVAGDGLSRIFYVLCMCLILQDVYTNLQNTQFKKWSILDVSRVLVGGYIVIWFVIMIFSSTNAWGWVVGKFVNDTYHYAEYNTMIADMQQTLPKDIWGNGEGTTFVCMDIARDKQAWAFFDEMDEEVKVMNQQPSLFVSGRYFPMVSEEYTVVKEWTLGETIFRYYEKGD